MTSAAMHDIVGTIRAHVDARLEFTTSELRCVVLAMLEEHHPQLVEMGFMASRVHQEITTTIQSPPGINSSHPEASRIYQQEYRSIHSSTATTHVLKKLVVQLVHQEMQKKEIIFGSKCCAKKLEFTKKNAKIV